MFVCARGRLNLTFGLPAGALLRRLDVQQQQRDGSTNGGTAGAVPPSHGFPVREFLGAVARHHWPVGAFHWVRMDAQLPALSRAFEDVVPVPGFLEPAT